MRDEALKVVRAKVLRSLIERMPGARLSAEQLNDGKQEAIIVHARREPPWISGEKNHAAGIIRLNEIPNHIDTEDRLAAWMRLQLKSMVKIWNDNLEESKR